MNYYDNYLLLYPYRKKRIIFFYFDGVDITISPVTKTGKVNIELIENGKKKLVDWRLDKQRTGKGTAYAQGVTSADLIGN